MSAIEQYCPLVLFGFKCLPAEDCDLELVHSSIWHAFLFQVYISLKISNIQV